MTVGVQSDGGSRTELAVMRFLDQYSVETMPRDPRAVSESRLNLAPGTSIYVACAPGELHAAIVAKALELKNAGFNPIPHVVARGLNSYNHLDQFLARIRGETGAEQALVLGGDISTPRGPFTSAHQLLETGLFAKHGFRAVGLATYPEGHPKIGTDELNETLGNKLKTAHAQGVKTWLVSQFCFDSETILLHAEQLRRSAIISPIHVGIAGPASRKTLLKFAMLCGIGNSMRALSSQSQRLGHLLGSYEPTALLAKLATAAHQRPTLGLERVHFFTFGGIEQTAKWIRALATAGTIQ